MFYKYLIHFILDFCISQLKKNKKVCFSHYFDSNDRLYFKLIFDKHFCRFYTCIQNQIIHKHVHVDYNPLKVCSYLFRHQNCQLYSAAGSESRGHSRTAYMAINRCQTASQVSVFVGFLISWISLPTKTTKIVTPRIIVISQYSK